MLVPPECFAPPKFLPSLCARYLTPSACRRARHGRSPFRAPLSRVLRPPPSSFLSARTHALPPFRSLASAGTRDWGPRWSLASLPPRLSGVPLLALESVRPPPSAGRLAAACGGDASDHLCAGPAPSGAHGRARRRPGRTEWGRRIPGLGTGRARTGLLARSLYPGLDAADEEEDPELLEAIEEAEDDADEVDDEAEALHDARDAVDSWRGGEEVRARGKWPGRPEGGLARSRGLANPARGEALGAKPKATEGEFAFASQRSVSPGPQASAANAPNPQTLPFYRYLSHRLEACRHVDQVLRLVARHRARMDDVHGAIALRSLARIVASHEEEVARSRGWKPRQATGSRGGKGRAAADQRDPKKELSELATNPVFLRLLEDFALTVQLRGFSRTMDLAYVPWSLAKLRLYLLPSLRPLLLQILRSVDVHTDAESQAPAESPGAAAGPASVRRQHRRGGRFKENADSKRACALRQLRPSGFTSLVWGASKCMYTNQSFWQEKLAPLLRDRAALLSPKELSICLYALANAGLRPRPSSHALPDATVAAEQAAVAPADLPPAVDASPASSAFFRFSESWNREGGVQDSGALLDGGRLSASADSPERPQGGDADAFGSSDREGLGEDSSLSAERPNGGESPDRDALTEAVGALGRACVEKLADMAAQGLSSVAWAFAKWRYPSAALFQGLASEIRRRGHKFDAQTATILLYAFVRLGYLDEPVLGVLTDVLVKQIGSFRRETFSLCAWAIAKLPRHSTVQRLSGFLYPALDEAPLQGYRRQDLIILLWSAARVRGRLAENLARRVFVELKRRKDNADFRAVDIAMLLHASSLAGVTDVDLLEHLLRLVPTLLSRGRCSLQELVWITASLAHLGTADEAFLSSTADCLEKRKTWDDASFVHLTSFLFFSVHLMPSLQRTSPSTRRLLELVRSLLFSPAPPLPGSFSSSSSPSAAFPASSPSSNPSSPSSPSLLPSGGPSASPPLPILQLSHAPQAAMSVSGGSSAPHAAATLCDARLALSTSAAATPAVANRVRFATSVSPASLKPSVFMNAAGALARSGLIRRDNGVVQSFLRFAETRTEEIDGVDWAKLHEAGERLGLGSDERWRRLLAEVPMRIQRRCMRPGASPPDDAQLPFLTETGWRGSYSDGKDDEDAPFEVVDEATIDKYAQEHLADGADDDWGDVEVDLGEPSSSREDSRGVPEGVDPADVITNEELYALLKSKHLGGHVDESAGRPSFDYAKQSSLLEALLEK
ncbi:hypothetical protein BESB_006080 [Besnoitia besnoiti]|uniref:RAP domain-containing protein n=1 Tax=Besnoitia besnoiti TaxID=94643 RepID=A0A2A9MQ44_BESBE|nr:hypothetical protein BESB_006080 [Besnoitia besnoiti]PFH38267.1 hypothetical protein BESB_006080 [Besnoitia besnoiti]